jgi:hypothetical protein
MGPDTICAEAYYSGDGRTAFAALLAGAHAKAEYSFADAGHDLPILRIDLLTYQICKIPNSKSQITNKSQIQIFNDPNGLGPRI